MKCKQLPRAIDRLATTTDWSAEQTVISSPVHLAVTRNSRGGKLTVTGSTLVADKSLIPGLFYTCLIASVFQTINPKINRKQFCYTHYIMR